LLPPVAFLESTPRTECDAAGTARQVADYIAGMTDRFAAHEHERLTGQRLLGTLGLND